MLFNLNDLKVALENDLVSIREEGNFSIDNVVFDSREVGSNSLFIAKKGERNDGHDFIESVLRANDTAVVLAERYPAALEKSARIILVKNTVKAFENLAVFSRRRVGGTTIGITGSIGKTSTKDIVSKVLSCYGRTHCSQQSFNNYIGTLTTLSNTPADSEYLVCEMGVQIAGEMGTLVDLVKPDVAIVMNIKPSHISYIYSEENIAAEKSLIINDKTKLAILNLDDGWYQFMHTKASREGSKIITFGTGARADVCLEEHRVIGDKASVLYRVGGKKYPYSFKNLDRSVAYNAMAALALVKHFDLSLDIALEAISSYRTTRGRNNIEYSTYTVDDKTINLTIINGSFNAVVPDVFVSGLRLMDDVFRLGKTNRKVCLWGDMLETGDRADEFHMSLRKPLLDSGIGLLLTVGDNMKKLSDSLRGTAVQLVHFSGIREMVAGVKEFLRDGDLVFIKSSKGIKTYEVLNSLVEEKMKLFL
ncbi:MAG: UDP-N-acetylmuramoyl-tripeptide--D-alanyl-D-alanine ligase [Rickettsiales bacterium]|jgi:UDP-N-acetylmuramoyl-tripeptide--D-alanyl-D-alanine ligase|nr:UDP-N-acetylmuramoyl-tripeptide--D-alanyl-D-alanine ligase [Rickettsiales bacterium]